MTLTNGSGTTSSAIPAEISRVAVRLPPFWPERPAVWFTQAEAQFTLAGISSEQTKFCYVISQLDQRYASEVEDIITSPPKRDPYTKLRTNWRDDYPPLMSTTSARSLHSRRATAKPQTYIVLCESVIFFLLQLLIGLMCESVKYYAVFCMLYRA
jgi:hypothetical protein